MKKYILVLALTGGIVLSLVLGVFAVELVWEDIGRGKGDFSAVLISSDNPNIIFAAAINAVLKSRDAGQSWERVLSIGGRDQRVNSLLIDSKNKNSIYALSTSGLFLSLNQGKDWKRIFKGKNSLENQCLAAALSANAIFLGTKAGLFVSRDKGRSWHKETGKISSSQISSISIDIKKPDCIYVACSSGVFKTQDEGKTWERIFIAWPKEVNGEDDVFEEAMDEGDRSSEIWCIITDPINANNLYLGTNKGVYESRDNGLSWKALSDFGLFDRKIRFLLLSEVSSILAVARSGIFAYKNERWQELSIGLIAQEIRSLAMDKQGNLYAATEKGLFKSSPFNLGSNKRGNPVLFYCQGEPGINQVQEVAIRYAEVEPEKIKAWRKQAAKKALLPQVSIGIDRDTTDLWHWEGGSTTKINDDILRRGRDAIDWGISLRWNLSDFIWNNDQASIDVRSQLMVKLRNNILDEVTKVYFERIRVKMELDSLGLEERKKCFEKELRLKELTASLDALTGNYFSGNCGSKSSAIPQQPPPVRR
ncbi:MAG: hypothetical protein QMD94_05565 [Candidatus Omnitrophota bacterium]|nr:hypothetical protein [Candidatus Omnitrophota bacterium]